MNTTKQRVKYRIHLPEVAMEVLRWHVDTQLGTAEMKESELLFPATTGGYRSPSVLNKPFEEVGRAISLRQHFTQPGLRRTFNDLARAAQVEGVVIKSISEHLTDGCGAFSKALVSAPGWPSKMAKTPLAGCPADRVHKSASCPNQYNERPVDYVVSPRPRRNAATRPSESGAWKGDAADNRREKIALADASQVKCRRRRSFARGAALFELGERREVVTQIRVVVAHDGDAVDTRQLEEAVGGDAQRIGGCPPGHPLAPHRVEDQEHTRALGRVGVGDSGGHPDGQLHGIRLHARSLTPGSSFNPRGPVGKFESGHAPAGGEHPRKNRLALSA
jgi:hypothetical protein